MQGGLLRLRSWRLRLLRLVCRSRIVSASRAAAGWFRRSLFAACVQSAAAGNQQSAGYSRRDDLRAAVFDYDEHAAAGFDYDGDIDGCSALLLEHSRHDKRNDAHRIRLDAAVYGAWRHCVLSLRHVRFGDHLQYLLLRSERRSSPELPIDERLRYGSALRA